MKMTAGYLRHAAFGLAILVGASVAAHARTDARTLSCQAAKDLVYGSGAIVLTTGPNTYDRYVAAQSYCAFPLVAMPAWIATADNPRCAVGFLCTQKKDD